MFRRTFVFLHFGGPFRLTLDTRSVLQWAAISTKTVRKLAKKKKTGVPQNLILQGFGIITHELR